MSTSDIICNNPAALPYETAVEYAWHANEAWDRLNELKVVADKMHSLETTPEIFDAVMRETHLAKVALKYAIDAVPNFRTGNILEKSDGSGMQDPEIREKIRSLSRGEGELIRLSPEQIKFRESIIESAGVAYDTYLEQSGAVNSLRKSSRDAIGVAEKNQVMKVIMDDLSPKFVQFLYNDSEGWKSKKENRYSPEDAGYYCVVCPDTYLIKDEIDMAIQALMNLAPATGPVVWRCESRRRITHGKNPENLLPFVVTYAPIHYNLPNTSTINEQVEYCRRTSALNVSASLRLATDLESFAAVSNRIRSGVKIEELCFTGSEPSFPGEQRYYRKSGIKSHCNFDGSNKTFEIIYDEVDLIMGNRALVIPKRRA